MEQWDPIGVKDSPEGATEYNGYRGGLVQLLCEGDPKRFGKAGDFQLVR